MPHSSDHQPQKPIKRLNATLPLPLAHHVAQMTGANGLYETPSEFIRDLIRRHMEATPHDNPQEINRLLKASLAENSYTSLHPDDFEGLRQDIRP